MTPDCDEQILMFRFRGLGNKKVSEELGITTRQVERRLQAMRKHGVAFPKLVDRGGYDRLRELSASLAGSSK